MLFLVCLFFSCQVVVQCRTTLGILLQGGGGGRTPKIGKNMIFWRKIVIFTRNTPKLFTPPSAIGKNKIFWLKIVFFHTKYPKIFRASLRSAQFF
jgi:hypothetical protein